MWQTSSGIYWPSKMRKKLMQLMLIGLLSDRSELSLCTRRCAKVRSGRLAMYVRDITSQADGFSTQALP